LEMVTQGSGHQRLMLHKYFNQEDILVSETWILDT